MDRSDLFHGRSIGGAIQPVSLGRGVLLAVRRSVRKFVQRKVECTESTDVRTDARTSRNHYIGHFAMDGNTARRKQVALLIEQNVEDIEFLIPYNALQKAGAEVIVVGSRLNETYRGKQGKLSIKADATTSEAFVTDFDAVIIPGGMAPDRMRTNNKTVRFVRDAFEAGLLVAAVCHGPQVLIDADLLAKLKATGFRSIRTDMVNAGAEFIDAPLVAEETLLTSRRPGDLPIFTTAILQRLELSITDTTLPNVDNMDAGWWKLGEEWGGSTKTEIVQAINTVIATERRGLEVFEYYANHVQDGAVAEAFRDIYVHKQQHIQRLEVRLSNFDETPSLQVAASSVLTNLKILFQADHPQIDILLRALRELQTAVVEVYNLCNQLSDPATVAIFDDIEVVLAQDEQQIASLYKSWLQAEMEEPASTDALADTSLTAKDSLGVS
jgi:protease I